MADDKKNISPEVEKTTEAPALEQPSPKPVLTSWEAIQL